MKASRRDYEAIAKLLGEQRIHYRKLDDWYLLARRMGDLLKQSNPDFDKNKFIRACEE